MTMYDIESRMEEQRRRSDAAWRPFMGRWGDLVRIAADRPWATPPRAMAALDVLLQAMAADAARVAGEDDFETRRGCQVLDGAACGDSLVVIFNNNPYRVAPARRGEELERYRRWLAGRRAAELAYAEYPDDGDDKGYTYALLLRCEPQSVEELWQKYRALPFESLT